MMKRLFDLVFALLGLIFAGPVLLLTGLLVKLSSDGPVFYRGKRAGLHDSTFHIFKFRTMIPNAEALGGHSTGLNDARLTPTGKFLRKYKLDELPQLFNILAGEMSFVGPRPQVLAYTTLYEGDLKRIMDVKPGLTDFASIEFINLDEILGDDDVDGKYQREIEPRKNQLRLKYVNEQGFVTDIKILILTAARMVGLKDKT
ncbi:MAG: sugar transferase [bacterium]|nr:sugar transferase [bacterium]